MKKEIYFPRGRRPHNALQCSAVVSREEIRLTKAGPKTTLAHVLIQQIERVEAELAAKGLTLMDAEKVKIDFTVYTTEREG